MDFEMCMRSRDQLLFLGWYNVEAFALAPVGQAKFLLSHLAWRTLYECCRLLYMLPPPIFSNYLSVLSFWRIKSLPSVSDISWLRRLPCFRSWGSRRSVWWPWLLLCRFSSSSFYYWCSCLVADAIANSNSRLRVLSSHYRSSLDYGSGYVSFQWSAEVDCMPCDTDEHWFYYMLDLGWVHEVHTG